MLSQDLVVEPLITENSAVFADLETRLITYYYKGLVTRENAVASAKWVSDLYKRIPHEKTFRGGIFDFREVTGFEIGIATVAQKYNREITKMQASNKFPIVYLVGNVRQEVKVRMSLVLSVGDAARKCVTYYPEEALTFINEWNLQQNRTFDLSEETLLAFPKLKTR
ncbi:MAG: hypothetical protein AAGD96_03545 [Chloroflexota bacterium]